MIDPITGERARSSRLRENRYKHKLTGAVIHVDVKKLHEVPPGGGWRPHSRDAAVSVANRHKRTKIGYGYSDAAAATLTVDDDDGNPGLVTSLIWPARGCSVATPHSLGWPSNRSDEFTCSG